MNNFTMRYPETGEIFEGSLRACWRIGQMLARSAMRHNGKIALTITNPRGQCLGAIVRWQNNPIFNLVVGRG